MATNKIGLFALLLVASTPAWSREAASVSECQSAAAKPAIADAKAAVDRTPGDLPAHFGLADAWSDAGCFNNAVQVLQAVQAQHPGNKELETRLRVARSLVGEEHYFDTLDRADAEAKLKRDSFRCTTLSDLEACSEAVRLKPDDPALLTAQADALMHAKSQTPSSDAGTSAGQRVATATKPQKPIRIARAEGMPDAGSLASPSPAAPAPGRRYTNAPQDDRSH